MGVDVIGGGKYERDGFKESLNNFRRAHEANSAQLLNIAAGREKDDPLPEYDPDHADNQWPTVMYHAEYGAKIIGKSLVGLTGAHRRETDVENKAALTAAEKSGYRAEPYRKPKVAVLDPESEKAALLARNKQLEGMINAQTDEVAKLREAVNKLLSKGKE